MQRRGGLLSPALVGMSTRPVKIVQCIHPECKTRPVWKFYEDYNNRILTIVFKRSDSFIHSHFFPNYDLTLTFRGDRFCGDYLSIDIEDNNYPDDIVNLILDQWIRAECVKTTFVPPASVYRSALESWFTRGGILLPKVILLFGVLPFLV